MAEAGTLRYTGMPARSDPAEFAAIDETVEAGWRLVGWCVRACG